MAYRRILVLSLAVLPLFASLSRSDPSTQPAATTQAARTPEQIQPEVRELIQKLSQVVKGGEVLLDDKTRAAAQPEAVPIINKLKTLAEEMEQTDNDLFRKQGLRLRTDMLALLSFFGDAQAGTDLQAIVDSPDPAISRAGKLSTITARWFATKDAAGQSALLESLEALGKADPRDDEVATYLVMMSRTDHTDPAVAQEAEKFLIDNMQGQLALQMKGQLQAVAKLKESIGKPLTVAGVKPDGTHFSTDSWKGKVVLIDIWASWCGPCVQGMPEVIKLYETYHEKGLEIVGVSCDQDATEFQNYLRDNPKVSWPQLFDPQNPGWHPAAQKLGVMSIPTMFLLDREGIVRAVGHESDVAKVLPGLIEEKGKE